VINKTLAQMNAERAAGRAQLDLLDGESYQIRKIKKAASLKLQASSALKRTQLNNRVKK
jgi:hypothetical protein